MSPMAPMLRVVLTPRQQRQAYAMVLLLCFFSAIEVISLGSVLPFIAALANPGLVRGYLHIDPLLASIGVRSDDGFRIFCGVLLVVVFALKNITVGFAEYARLRWSYRLAADLSNRLLRHYMSQEYRYFLDVNVQTLLKNVSSETWTIVSGVMIPLLTIVSEVMVGALLYVVLLAVNYRLTLTASAGLAAFALLTYAIIRRNMHRVGEERERSLKGIYQDLANALTGIKVIKVMECENHFAGRVAQHVDDYTSGTIYYNTMGVMPRLALEFFAVVGVVVTMMVMLLGGSRSFSEIMPVVSLYAVAIYRFMPAANRVITSRLSIKFNRRALEVVAADLKTRTGTPGRGLDSAAPMEFTKSIALRGVTFRYSAEHAEKTIDDFSLEIPKGHTIGIVGASGCGKTTIIDILLGLLFPESGTVTVDGRPLSRADMPSWHELIGYIPQDNFLYDETLLKNVAFGVPDAQIDRRAVEDAIQAAQLQDLVASLPDGLETLLGDRGVRMSGGQRQRVGIARALYRDPQILVFDEATSSLDSVTEREIGKAIEWLGGRKTIVIVAHRLTTVRRCDTIYVMDRGQIIASGTYDELLAHSVDFQRLALGAA
jgi:ABC-type multidrug transport system fused ATPase/permease subunit